jgi:hypothetical protein
MRFGWFVAVAVVARNKWRTGEVTVEAPGKKALLRTWTLMDQWALDSFRIPGLFLASTLD